MPWQSWRDGRGGRYLVPEQSALAPASGPLAWNRLVDVRAEPEAARSEVTKRAEPNAENALRVANCIMQSDPRRLFHADGRPRSIHKLDDDTAQAVSVEIIDGVVKMGFWPKTEGLTQIVRHLGLFERDHRQRAPNLALQVNLVQAPAANRTVRRRRTAICWKGRDD